MKSNPILFLASNPVTTNRLALDEEARDIEVKIRAAEHREAFLLKTRWAVRPDDLLQALNEDQPVIVHFSGHGAGTPGIAFHDDAGHEKLVTSDALKHVFAALRDRVRVVVLNACYSAEQAQAIVEVIDFVIGMNDSIGDVAARRFAASFYRALGFGRSVQNAFDQGIAAIKLEGLKDHNVPELLARSGVSADAVVLVQTTQEQSVPNVTSDSRGPADAGQRVIAKGAAVATALALTAGGAYVALRPDAGQQSQAGAGGARGQGGGGGDPGTAGGGGGADLGPGGAGGHAGPMGGGGGGGGGGGLLSGGAGGEGGRGPGAGGGGGGGGIPLLPALIEMSKMSGIPLETLLEQSGIAPNDPRLLYGVQGGDGGSGGLGGAGGGEGGGGAPKGSSDAKHSIPPARQTLPATPSPGVVISSVNQSGGITAQNVTINNAPPVKTIDFNGAHRTTRPGYNSVVGGTPEQEAFAEMIKLHDRKAWADLEVLADRTVKKFPYWSTGFLFLGVAQANLGKRDSAMASLAQVVQKGDSDPAYEDAARVLDQLRAATP